MKLRCPECKNESSFMATAKTEIEILVDGGGKLIDARAFDQVLEKFEDITPQRCALCGSSKIEDMEKANDNHG